MKEERPLTTVIIPARMESGSPRALSCLQSLADLNLEVLVTRGSCPSLQRNLAAGEANGEFLYFLDDDCTLTRDAVVTGIEFLLRNDRIAVTGGPAVTRQNAGILETAIGDAMASRAGSLITRSRHAPTGKPRETSGEAFTLCNLMIRRDVYLKLAGLNGDLHPGEDPEFLKRLSGNGFHAFYQPNMAVERSRRRNFKDLALQFYRYGRGRARHILQAPRIFDWIFVLPSILVLGLPVLMILRSAIPVLLYTVYLLLCITAGIHSAVKRRSFLFLLLVPSAVFTMHASYGLGFLRGLLPAESHDVKEDGIKIERA